MNANDAFLHNLFLVDPETGRNVEISSVKAAESGLDHIEIIVTGESSSWKHRIFTEEI